MREATSDCTVKVCTCSSDLHTDVAMAWGVVLVSAVPARGAQPDELDTKFSLYSLMYIRLNALFVKSRCCLAMWSNWSSKKSQIWCSIEKALLTSIISVQTKSHVELLSYVNSYLHLPINSTFISNKVRQSRERDPSQTYAAAAFMHQRKWMERGHLKERE